VPAFSTIDLDASEVEVRGTGGDLVDANVAKDTRRMIAEALKHSATGGNEPARFRALVESSGGFNGLCILWLSYLPIALVAGSTCSHAEVSVDLSFESGGMLNHGVGTASTSGSIYAGAYKRALMLAVQDALTHAQRNTASRADGRSSL